MLNRIIAGIVVILIGTTLLPALADDKSFNKGLIRGLWFRICELIGWTVTDKPKKKRRQSYLQYVRERKEVERLMK